MSALSKYVCRKGPVYRIVEKRDRERAAAIMAEKKIAVAEEHPVLPAPPPPPPDQPKAPLYVRRRRISAERYVAEIQKATCAHFGVAVDDIVSRGGDKRAGYARRVAIFLARKHTQYSYPEIGRRFGGRDHTTILDSAKKNRSECRAGCNVARPYLRYRRNARRLKKEAVVVVNFDWTDEAVALLRGLVLQGYSATQIAAAMSARYEWVLTRNAIIGKTSRMHIRLGVKAGEPLVETKKPKVKKPAPPKPKTAREAKPMPMPVVIEKPVVEIVVPASGRVTLLDLEPGMCRFPLGDPRASSFTFCGEKAVVSRSYCGFHAQIAYVPLPVKAKARAA